MRGHDRHGDRRGARGGHGKPRVGERGERHGRFYGSSASATALKGKHRITLITGDRVTLDAKGRVLGLEPAEGREHIPVQIRRADGHTLVVPADAARLVASGTLDQRLFDVTELNNSATRRAHRAYLKVIVGYRGAAKTAKADVRDAGTVRRALTSLNADAVQTPQDATADLWDAVTDGDRTAAGVARVWLDGVRKASLDTSVGQIGAPKAWQVEATTARASRSPSWTPVWTPPTRTSRAR